MAHEWRKQVCAIDELRLSKKSMAQGRSIDFFPMAHQRRMAHTCSSSVRDTPARVSHQALALTPSTNRRSLCARIGRLGVVAGVPSADHGSGAHVLMSRFVSILFENMTCYFLLGYRQGIKRMQSATSAPDRAPPTAKPLGQVFARGCKVCRHPERWRIELLKAGGASLRSLEEKFGVHKNSIDRHFHRHVSAELKASYLLGPVQLQELAAKAAEQGGSVLDHLHAIRVVLMRQMSAMVEANDGRGVAYVAGRLTSVLETIARISGELGDLAKSTVYNITTNNVAMLSEHPAFAKLQATMLRALAEFPDARAAVVAALRGLDAESARASSTAPAIGKVIEHVPS
jgi:hypothetical protein